ncbi:hypothetical protein Agabi119p4_9893 [Agaricus bisporus var. burnettii]|uniref:Nephrocystin 3-like N-terminal domain-containing protein n=1 Tax=Agaricus bisporus var. burnettii TaxID=192524 RepID=A0A8H7C4M9_AGABI|nr:hypothetical protein Agabi119p4_9893 [Agaricus bisporus var. burnettii]
MSLFGNSNDFQVNVNNSHLVAADSVHYHGSRGTGELHCPTCDSWLGADDYDEGLGRLYDESLPDAMHNSAARSLADITLPTTRCAGIIEELAAHFGQPQDSLLPNVVVANDVKSNLAQICAEELEEYSCATFFVSKRFKTDNPAKLFTTIASQLAIQFPPYASILEAKLRRNPSLLRQSLEHQFQELIVEPFNQLSDQVMTNFGSPRKLIIIDGLDEYANPRARSKILRIIFRSAEKLPFVWLLFTQSNVYDIQDGLSAAGQVGRPARVRIFGDSERSCIAFSNDTKSICAVLLAQQEHRIAANDNNCTLKLRLAYFFF